MRWKNFIQESKLRKYIVRIFRCKKKFIVDVCYYTFMIKIRNNWRIRKKFTKRKKECKLNYLNLLNSFQLYVFKLKRFLDY